MPLIRCRIGGNELTGSMSFGISANSDIGGGIVFNVPNKRSPGSGLPSISFAGIQNKSFYSRNHIKYF